MIHAYVEPHEKTNPQMIIDIKDMYINAANENKILVMPVGIAFENAYKKRPNLIYIKSMMVRILTYLGHILHHV